MENLIEELTKVNPSNLSKEGLKLFNKINEIIDRNKELEEAIHNEYELGRAQTEYEVNEYWKSLIKEKIEELENKPVCLCTRSNGKNDEALQHFINNTVVKLLQELMEDK